MNTRRGTGTSVLSKRATTLKVMLVLVGSCVLSHALVPTATAQAQRREMSLTLREATAFALQSNLEIQIAGLNPPIREAQITEREGVGDAVDFLPDEVSAGVRRDDDALRLLPLCLFRAAAPRLRFISCDPLLSL